MKPNFWSFRVPVVTERKPTADLSSHFGGDHKHDRQECNRVRSFDCFFMPVELDGFCAWGERKEDDA